MTCCSTEAIFSVCNRPRKCLQRLLHGQKTLEKLRTHPRRQNLTTSGSTMARYTCGYMVLEMVFSVLRTMLREGTLRITSSQYSACAVAGGCCGLGG